VFGLSRKKKDATRPKHLELAYARLALVIDPKGAGQFLGRPPPPLTPPRQAPKSAPVRPPA